MLESAHERIMMMMTGTWKGRKLMLCLSFSLTLSPPEWRSPSLYTHHPRRILEMIIITQYEYLCSVDRIVKESGAVLQDSSVARRGEEF